MRLSSEKWVGWGNPLPTVCFSVLLIPICTRRFRQECAKRQYLERNTARDIRWCPHWSIISGIYLPKDWMLVWRQIIIIIWLRILIRCLINIIGMEKSNIPVQKESNLTRTMNRRIRTGMGRSRLIIVSAGRRPLHWAMYWRFSSAVTVRMWIPLRLFRILPFPRRQGRISPDFLIVWCLLKGGTSLPSESIITSIVRD